MQRNKLSNAQGGFTLLNLIMTLAIFALVATTAISNIKILENPLANTSFHIAHYIRLARARAISQTQFIQVEPLGTNRIVAYSSDSCTGDQEDIDDLYMDLDEAVQLASTDWVVCFSPRGLANEHVTFDFYTETASKTVQIALGGGVKIE